MNPQVINPNDHKVVSFHNSTDFGFTPEMGCMFDGRPINGKSGLPGIQAGETIALPYHIGHQLALNLAKVSFTRRSSSVDAAGIPTGVPMWDEGSLISLKNSFIKEMYSEERPKVLSETDKMMAKIDELQKFVNEKIGSPVESTEVVSGEYKDKQDIIAELDKKGIKHDKRKSKEELQKLLVTPIA